MRRIPLLAAVASTLLSVGCMASGSARYDATITTPNLVYIDSDVQVIADYDEPIFYASNYYWRYDSGAWYRSHRHNTGWIRIEVVPVAIRRIERPTAYIHYRAGARATAAPAPTRVPAQPVREIREERKEIKEEQKEQRQEIKEERKDQKEERKEERKEIKEERKDQKEERKDQKEERKDERKDQKDAKKPGKSGR